MKKVGDVSKSIGKVSKMKLRGEVISLRAQGCSFRQIAAQLGIAAQTALNWSRECSRDIEEAKAIELDALRVQVLHAHAERVAQSARILKNFYAALERKTDAELANESISGLLRCALELEAKLMAELPTLTGQRPPQRC